MKIIFKTDSNLNFSRDRIEKKFRSLGRFFKNFKEDKNIELRLELFKETNHNKGDVYHFGASLILPGNILRVDELSDSIGRATKKSYQELKRQIIKSRGSRLSRIKKRSKAFKELIFKK